MILAVGGNELLEPYVTEKTEIIDYGEKLLMPGFVDGHTHMMAYAPKVDLSDAESIEECVEMIREFYEGHKETDCVRAEKWYAANWDGTMPAKQDIDEVVKDVPFLQWIWIFTRYGQTAVCWRRWGFGRIPLKQ